MNSLPLQPNFTVENYLEELRNMRDELQKVLQQHKTLLTEHKLLKQKVDEMTDNGQSAYTSTRVEEGKHVVENIISVLKEAGRPMLVKEIGEMLKSRNVIPIQILNIKTYVNRRLEIACASGLLGIYYQEELAKKYYYLHEWVDEYGSVQHMLIRNNIQF